MPNDLNRFFSALSSSTRRKVIEHLARGPASVKELHAAHDMALPTFMRHLKVLEDSGLIRSMKKGRVRTCQIDPQSLIAAQGWLEWQREVLDKTAEAEGQFKFSL